MAIHPNLLHIAHRQELPAGSLPRPHLIDERSILRHVLDSRASHSDHAVAIAGLVEAERAAKAGDPAQVLGCLKKAGTWPWEVAMEIGATLAAETLQKS